MSEIEFFGAVDKTRDGKISGVMPAWFFDVHLEKLEESVSRKKRQLERNQIPQNNVFMIKNEIKAEEDKIIEIKKTMPRVTGKDKDTVAKDYFSIGQQLAESMPTRRDEFNGFANAREELKKDTTPGIKISPEMARAMGVTPAKGNLITRKQAVKFYKMAGKILGENTNVERLRRDGQSESYRTMEDLTKRILEKVAG